MILKSLLQNIRIIYRVIKNWLRYTRYRAEWLVKSKRSLGQKKEIIWISQYYRPENQGRQKEIDAAFQLNLNLKSLKRSVIFTDCHALPFDTKKPLEIIPLNRRLTFNDVFNYIALENHDAGSVFCITNSDIALTNDIEKVAQSLTRKELITLTRWERVGGLTYKPLPEIHQDCWMLLGFDLKDLLPLDQIIPFGVPGCDHRVASAFYHSGFNIWNPCLNVKTYHFHTIDFRTYDDSMRINGGYYFPKECCAEEFFLKKPPRFILKRS